MAVRFPAHLQGGANGRPNLAPAALVMAQILPVYDEAWDRLRTEYLEVSCHQSFVRLQLMLATRG
jgi:hypothetical protein